MKRLAIAGALLLLVLAIVLAIVRFRSADPRPVDPATPVHLDDGRVLPLAEALVALRAGSVAPQDRAQGERAFAPASSGSDPGAQARAVRSMDDALFRQADTALEAGRVDEAIALYLSIEPDSRHYSRARRIVGWDIHTRRRSKPLDGVTYVEQALLHSPFEANCWQDIGRVYGRSLGIEVH